jgi:hypothetical protein
MVDTLKRIERLACSPIRAFSVVSIARGASECVCVKFRTGVTIQMNKRHSARHMLMARDAINPPHATGIRACPVISRRISWNTFVGKIV